MQAQYDASELITQREVVSRQVSLCHAFLDCDLILSVFEAGNIKPPV